MLVSNVSLDDGRQCAALINALNAARFTDLSGKDIEAFVAAKRWLHEVATQMAGNLQRKPTEPATSTPVPTTGFRVKSMGQLPGNSTSKSNKKKK